MKHLLLIISGITLGSSALYFWYCEMFSDGFVGWFSRAFNRTRWKNFIALSQPAGGLFFVLGALALVGPMIDSNIFNSRHDHSPFWSYWTAVLVLLSMLFMLIALTGFIPFTLPEWMYPEYHAAKREEQRRREAAERGEIEDRNPLLDDDGVYASQLGNIPTDIPEASALPSTAAPRSPQAVPSAEGPPPPHSAPEAGAPALHGPDVATSDAGTANALDITAAIASLPRTGTPTSHGARPARASRARRGHGDAATTPTGTREDPNGDA